MTALLRFRVARRLRLARLEFETGLLGLLCRTMGSLVVGGRHLAADSWQELLRIVSATIEPGRASSPVQYWALIV